MTTSSSGVRRYQIPVYLLLPDRFDIAFFGLTVSVTIREGLIFLVGWSFVFTLWKQLAFLAAAGTPGLIVRLLFPGLLALITIVWARLRLQGRPLEVWLATIAAAQQRPTVYLWQRVSCLSPIDDDALSPKDQKEERA